MITHESVQAGGFGAEVAATVAEELGVPVKRVAAPRIPVGYARTLENVSRISREALLTEIKSFQTKSRHNPARSRS